MADQTKIEHFLEAFPPATIPTVFADGVVNLAYNPRVTKFYLFRTDPSLKSESDYLNQPFAQIVMPLDAFVQAAAFFNQGVERMVAIGLITKEQVEALRIHPVKAAGL
jgi:hypothetical protein